MKTMLAAVYRDGAGLQLEQRPVPRIGAAELLVRIENASICATDIRIIKGAHRKFGAGTVRIPGHEIVATVEEAGSSVHGFEIGQRVFIAPNIGCGRCVPCRRGKNNLCPDYDAFGITFDGGFAEYMRVTAAAIEQGNVIPLPADVDSAGAALAEPFACVLHGQDAVGTAPGDVVVVMGAGPIGLMHAKLALARAVKCVILADPAAERRALAARVLTGSVAHVSSDDLAIAVAEHTDGTGADAVIVAAPSREAQQQALRIAAPGGRINFFAGLPKDDPSLALDANLIHYNELVLTGTTACSTADCRRAVELVVSGAVDLTGLISARLPLARAEEAFAAAQDRRNLKVVFEMGASARAVGGSHFATQAV